MRNELPVDNPLFKELTKQFLKKYTTNEEVNTHLRKNQDTLEKIIEMDEFPLTDLLKQRFVTGIQITKNTKEVNQTLEDIMLNRMINLDLEDTETLENSLCLTIYYDVQKMHCLSCGKEALVDLIDDAIKRLGIRKNEIVFCLKFENTIKE